MRRRIEQHREIPPRRPFFKPGGRNLPPDVAVNVFENFGALFLGLRGAELLHKLLVDPDRLAEQLLRDCLVVLALERAEVGILAEALLRRLAHRARLVLQRVFQRRAGLLLGHLGEVLLYHVRCRLRRIGGNAEVFDQVVLDVPQHRSTLKRVASDDLADGRTRLAHRTEDFVLHHLRRRFFRGGLVYIAADCIAQHHRVRLTCLHRLVQAVEDVQSNALGVAEICAQRQLPDAAVLADCRLCNRAHHHAAALDIVIGQRADEECVKLRQRIRVVRILFADGCLRAFPRLFVVVLVRKVVGKALRRRLALALTGSARQIVLGKLQDVALDVLRDQPFRLGLRTEARRNAVAHQVADGVHPFFNRESLPHLYD